MMLQQTGKRPDPEPAAIRQPPHNVQLEQALLGAILMNNAAVDRLDGLVDAADFFDPLHGEIFSVAVATVRAGRVANPITLRTFFENAEPMAPDMTVPQYLGRLVVNATTIINTADYARSIHALSVRRRLIMVGEDIVNTAFDAPHDHTPEAQIEAAEKELTALAERHATGDESVPVSVAFDETIKRIEVSYKSGSRLVGISTGLTDLDTHIGGLEPGNLYSPGGRPGSGKTALVTGIAWHVAAHLGLPVDFYSLEMPRDQLAARILASVSGIPVERQRRGQIEPREFDALMHAAREQSKAPLHIDHRSGITIGQLQARARRMKRQHGTRLIVVDYIQLLAGSGNRRSDNRVNELTEITTGLKAMAKELHCPVIALSQLSRAVETRAEKRPQLSDLRESGSIEQDSDVVLFLYREEYYLAQQKPPETDIARFIEWQSKMRGVQGKAEVIVGKNRHGPTGTVELAFDGPLTRFSNLARDSQAERFHD